MEGAPRRTGHPPADGVGRAEVRTADGPPRVVGIEGEEAETLREGIAAIEDRLDALLAAG